MHRVMSFDDIGSKLVNCKHVCLLFDGTVQSVYLLHLICLHNIRVTAVVLDFGAADRDKLKMLASQFPSGLEFLDASDLYEASVVMPMIRGAAICNDRDPLIHSMTESVSAQVLVNFARHTACDALVHAYIEHSHRNDYLNRAIASCGYEGLYGCPGEHEGLSAVQQSANLLRLGCQIREDVYQRWASSFLCQSYLLHETRQGSGDFQFPDSNFYWGKTGSPVSTVTSIDFLNGLPVGMDGELFDLSSIIMRLSLVAGPAGLGRFSGEDYVKQGIRYLELHIAPAAYVIARAIKDLEVRCLPSKDVKEKRRLEDIWIANMRSGKFFSRVKMEAENQIAGLCAAINGRVELDISSGAYSLRHTDLCGTVAAHQGRIA